MADLPTVPTDRIEYTDRRDITDPKRQKNFATNQGVRLHVEDKVLKTREEFLAADAALASANAALAAELKKTREEFAEFADNILAVVKELDGRWYNRLARWARQKLQGSPDPCIPPDIGEPSTEAAAVMSTLSTEEDPLLPVVVEDEGGARHLRIIRGSELEQLRREAGRPVTIVARKTTEGDLVQ